MKLKIYYILSIFFFLLPFVYGQKPIQYVNAVRFTIENKKDTIEFLKLNEDLEIPKPTIIFCQGSLPIPLILDLHDGSRKVTGISNFDYNKLIERFNIILVSMPHIPLIVKKEHLNDQYAYVTDTNNVHSYPQAYLDDNYLEKYVERGNAVIEFLLQQKWVNKKHIVIVGHSLGAKVATKIASENNHISALGFLSGNPVGRIEQFVRQSRLLELKGRLSPEKAQEEINRIYDWWKWMHEHPDTPSQKGEDSPRTVISFSNPVLPDLLKINIPVYIAYGTRDIGSSYCDLLPLDFIQAGKTNYKVVPYLGLEHNYFEVDSMGKPDYDKCHWDEVMSDFIDWLYNNFKYEDIQ